MAKGTAETFKAFYEAELVPVLKELENERKKHLLLYFIPGLVGLSIALFVVPTVFNTFFDLVLNMGEVFGGGFSDPVGNIFSSVFRFFFTAIFVFILCVTIYILAAKLFDYFSRRYRKEFSTRRKIIYTIITGILFITALRMINLLPFSFNLYRVFIDFREGGNAVFWHTFKWFLIIIGSVFLMVPLMLFINSKENKFVLKFKETVVKKIVAFIDDSLSYLPDRSIPQADFVESKIFFGTPDSHYSGSDFVSGERGDVKFRFSQVSAKEKSKSTKSNDDITLFRGILFITKFNKKFTKEHFVLPDIAEKAFGIAGESLQKLNRFRPPLVKLENIEFEEHFAVYSGDETECRYILSLSLMERIVDLRKKFKKSFSLSFVNSNLYLAVSYDADLYRPPLFFSQIDYDGIKEMYDSLSLFTDIVDELNLNLKIWGS
ncbi:MAG: DUF3137 domain-containing protein [Ignavibacteriaceae bacterium]